ncbi:MAG: Smr/MutS family protein [Candidatus Woesearchaeota archaeon]|nr:Smr/MutS family protein [Candidatus Woesearchaeota archaeon]
MKIDVHGMNKEEALKAVRLNLLLYYNMGYPEVQIVHGHGQGILKEAVRNCLGNIGYVKKIRVGKPSEGGDGATIAIF